MRSSPGMTIKVLPKQIEPDSRHPGFMLKQFALERQSATIAGQAAIGADHPMARHDQGNGIGAIGGASLGPLPLAPLSRRSAGDDN